MLAQGGRIHRRHDVQSGHIVEAGCLTRDGWLLSDCKMGIFKRLKRRDLIASANGQPYRAGLAAVRAQLDNR